MKKRIQVAVEAGDIRYFGADVVALRYAQGLQSASKAVASALGKTEDDVRTSLSASGSFHLFPGEGRISAKNALFVNVVSPESSDQTAARRFCRDVLKGLFSLAPETRHLAMTLRVPGIANAVVALRAQVAGCLDAIAGREFPPDLEKISFLERESNAPLIWELQAALHKILPAREIEAEVPDIPEVSSKGSPAEVPFGVDEYDVFISYKSEDLESARKVYDFLRSHGLSVFFSKESLPRLGSDEYREQIDLAIERTRHMTVVTTAAENVMAKWVKYEWGLFLGEKLAGRKRGNLVTVIAGSMGIGELPIALRNREVIPLVPGELEKLVEYVKPDRERLEQGGRNILAHSLAAPAEKERESTEASFTDASRFHSFQGFVVSKTERLKNTSWTNALDYSRSLSLGGTGGWRLPSIEELMEIRKASLFPSRWAFWSSKEAGSPEAFYVHFDDGHVGRGPKSYANGLGAVFVKDKA